MKLSKYLVGTLACALMAACSNEENPAVDNGTQGQKGEQAYIAVRLMAPNMASRAFQDGSPEENAVTSARFYFFDNVGTAVDVNDDSDYNYKDLTPTFEEAQSPADENGNVEEYTKDAFIVLENETQWPTQMVVVLNPPTDLTGSKSLSDLRAAADDYGSTTSFVMSNAVYITSNDGKQIDAVNVENYVTNDADAAKLNPITVYVERVLARVDVNGTGDLADNVDGTGVNTNTITGLSTPTTDTEVQAVIKGWTIANRNSQSHLLKSLSTWSNTTSITIDEAASTSWTFNEWNAESNHRSYWAYTDDVTATKIENDSYTDIIREQSSQIAKTKYCQENTGNGEATEIVVIAQLTVDNNPVTIAKYAGEYWTAANLLQQFANQIITGIYYKANSGEPTSVTKLTADIIKFRPRTSAETSVVAYRAVLDLQNKYKTGYTFYSDAVGQTEIDLDDVLDVLNNYTVLLWHEGKTYYHTTIKHTLNNKTLDGVVRNHLYNISLTGVQGLGTPIPGDTSTDDPGDDDPEDKPIDPENPQDDYSYLAARINILSWNIISQDNVILGQ